MTAGAFCHRRCMVEIEFFERGGNHDLNTPNLKSKTPVDLRPLFPPAARIVATI
jgi:hypothetical protein